MSDKSLILNNRKISYEEIKTGAIKGDSSFEQSTLTFCRQWLNGLGLFSLKTSGSTGEPKPIRISRYQMRLSAQQTIAFFNLKPADTVLVCLNTAYIAGIMMLVRAFEAGAHIIAVEPTGNPLQGIKQQIDFIAVVPLQLQQILNNADSKTRLENCRSSIVGGAPVSVKLQEKLQSSTASVYATFGMTETLTHFALKQLNPQQKDYFSAFEGVIIRQDSRRCLIVASAVTEEKEVVTNDLVEILSANTFKWLGRVDNVINSGGVKLQIETLERKVEQAFHELGLTNRFFVSSLPDDALGEKVILIIESRNKIDSLYSIDWTKYFTSFEKPKELMFYKHFEETPTGKVNRQKTIKMV